MADVREMIRGWGNDGRARLDDEGKLELSAARASSPREKLRNAYDWLVDEALVCPFRDMEFGAPVRLGARDASLVVRREAAYASFALLPLLNLVVSRRLLIVGSPGKGKTTIATLMALLGGAELAEVRRCTQRGHPQLTVTDLLGSPLPADLVRATDQRAIHVSWRSWLDQRVKIVDEYNRIPTKTQSALLSLMAEGCVEMFEQIKQVSAGPWYLTANDELGGGTFQVIAALKDRIDAVVRAAPFAGSKLPLLAERVARAVTPENLLPADIVLSAAELDSAHQQVRSLPLADGVLEVLGTLASQLEFCGRASPQLPLMNKDTLHLSGRRLSHVCNEDCPLDKQENLCTQSENGVSARAHQSLLALAQALAYFRGEEAVGLFDVRALLPWVLHDKLQPNAHSAYFQKDEHQVLLSDRAAWIHTLFDRAVAHHASHARIREPVKALSERASNIASQRRVGALQSLQTEIERLMESLLARNELHALLHEDLVELKRLHGDVANRMRSLRGPQ